MISDFRINVANEEVDPEGPSPRNGKSKLFLAS